MIRLKNGISRGITQNKFLVAHLFLFLLVAIIASNGFAVPKKVPTAKPGDCTACHGDQKVLHSDHPDTTPMKRADCLSCHQKASRGSLHAKMTGSHTHNFAGVTCEKCHGKAQKRQAVEMAKCVTCHNPTKLVEKTSKVKPENPHTSPHYGDSLDCNLCHHQHGKSENYCNQCHKFDFQVP